MRSRLSSLEIRSQIGGTLVSQLAILLERAIDDALEVDRHCSVLLAKRTWRLLENRIGNHGGCVAGKRLPARRHLVKNRAEGKQIGPRIQGVSAQLLWRHVGHGADDGSRLGQCGDGCVL